MCIHVWYVCVFECECVYLCNECDVSCVCEYSMTAVSTCMMCVSMCLVEYVYIQETLGAREEFRIAIAL